MLHSFPHFSSFYPLSVDIDPIPFSLEHLLHSTNAKGSKGPQDNSDCPSFLETMATVIFTVQRILQGGELHLYVTINSFPRPALIYICIRTRPGFIGQNYLHNRNRLAGQKKKARKSQVCFSCEYLVGSHSCGGPSALQLLHGYQVNE